MSAAARPYFDLALAAIRQAAADDRARREQLARAAVAAPIADAAPLDRAPGGAL